MIYFFQLLFCFFLFSPVQAQDIETIIKEIRLEIDSKQLAQSQAINEVSIELVEEMLGEEKFQAKREKIEEYIIKNKNHYVLSTRSSKPTLQEEGDFTSLVTLKISKENLKNLLLEHKLFYDSKGSFCFLPIVSFISHFDKKKNYSWWLENKNIDFQLKEISSSFFQLFSEELIKQGFYALNPVFQKMYEGTPSFVLPRRGFNVKNFIPLANFYTCDMILSGSIQLGKLSDSSKSSGSLFSFFKPKQDSSLSDKYFTKFFFNVFNIKTRQFLFKIQKQFPFDPISQNNPQKEVSLGLKNVLDSFTYQLSLYHQKGSLDLNRLMISVQGPLNYGQKEQLKKLLVQNVSSLKSLQERFLTSNRVLYEAEASQSIRVIAKQLRTLSLSEFVVQVKGYRKYNLEIYAKKKE